MAKVPDLTDGNVVLRPWRPDDADWYAAQSTDPDIQRLTSEPPDVTAQQVRDAIARYADDPTNRGWVTCATDTGERLGNAGMDLDEMSVSYWVAAPARGRGVATAALRLMTAHAFATTDLAELRLWVKSGNHASARVAEKAGFHRAPHLDETRTIKGEPWSVEFHTLPRPQPTQT